MIVKKMKKLKIKMMNDRYEFSNANEDDVVESEFFIGFD